RAQGLVRAADRAPPAPPAAAIAGVAAGDAGDLLIQHVLLMLEQFKLLAHALELSLSMDIQLRRSVGRRLPLALIRQRHKRRARHRGLVLLDRLDVLLRLLDGP